MHYDAKLCPREIVSQSLPQRIRSITYLVSLLPHNYRTLDEQDVVRNEVSSTL